MHTLSKRLTFLEKATPAVDKVIFIVFVEVGEVERELTYIYDKYGNQWDRCKNETEPDFRSRALSEAPRTKNCPTMLFGKHFVGSTASK